MHIIARNRRSSAGFTIAARIRTLRPLFLKTLFYSGVAGLAALGSLISANAVQLNGTAPFPSASGTPATDLFTEIPSFNGLASSYIWTGTDVNVADYPLTLWSNYSIPPTGVINVITSGPNANIGNTYFTGYSTVSMYVRGAGLYSFSVTGSGVTSAGVVDLMAALYASTAKGSAFNPANNLQNLVMLNDDSQGNGTGSDPYTLYYNNTNASACVDLTLVMYNWATAAGSATYNISGPGNIATNCSALGPDAANTLCELQVTAQSTETEIIAAQSRLDTMLGYDTNNFGKEGWSIAFAGRYGDLASETSEGAGALIAAKRVTPNFRVGGFIDYAGAITMVNGIAQHDATPSLGAFAVYQAHPDYTGFTARLAYAFSRDSLTITRDGSLDSTEPGSGTTNLTGYGISGTFGYGFRASEKIVLQPYASLRYFDTFRAGYTENTVPNLVAYPISYDPYGERLTTGEIGLRLYGVASAQVSYFVGLGCDFDLATEFNNFSGSSAIFGLESFSIPTEPNQHRIRATGVAGAKYDIAANQRITTELDVSQLPYTSVASVTSILKYSVGF